MVKQKIEDFCKTLGLHTIGFIPCRNFEELRDFYRYRKENNLQNEFEEKDIEKRINPNLSMEEGKTIISIAFPYYHSNDEESSEEKNHVVKHHEDGNLKIHEELNHEEENHDGKNHAVNIHLEEKCKQENLQKENNGFSVYTKRADYHRVVNSYLAKICEYIESLGGKAKSFVDSNSLPERYIAYLAGVGFIGRNNMIITKEYGSYVFLGEIITDLEIDCKDKRTFSEISEYKECIGCERCIKECPTKSINKTKINPNICLSYITQKKEISDKEIGLLKGNVFGCDFCQLKCPYNEEVEINVLKEFKTLDYMNGDVYTFATMDNKFFKEKISGTSCGWRGKNVIKRNAIIHMHNKNYDISEFKGDSEYINGYINRMLGD